MKFRSISWLGLVLALAIAPLAAPAQAHAHRVVFAVSSPEEADWQITMHNISHVLVGFQPDPVEVELVAFGPGVVILRADSPVHADLESFAKQGVHLAACENAMRAFHLQLNQLVPGATSVPSGIIEIIRKQEEGWSYIKGGR